MTPASRGKPENGESGNGFPVFVLKAAIFYYLWGRNDTFWSGGSAGPDAIRFCIYPAFLRSLLLLNERKPMSKISSAAFADTKPHYDILDGLRGVAAITVVWFHLFEAYATSHLDQRINHGYLAVDFFFILSGFVIGYAYDDRWKKKMSVADFLKRRLIRLHPMVVMGAVIGAVMFYFQGCSVWDVSTVSVSMLLAATLLNALLIPATPGSEIRGLGEMYPLNGPSWSLFFEYIGNILYALFIHKLPTRALSVLVLLAGCGLAAFAVWGPLGDICVGFAMDGDNMLGGSLRLLFGAVFGFFYAPLVITGLHHMSNAIDTQLCADFGGTMLWPMIALSNIAQGSAVLGMIYLQRKNARAQEVNIPSCISCYLGVTEPAMFGVNLKYNFPFICAMIGSGIAGAFSVMTSSTANSIGVGGLPGILSMQPQSMGTFAIAMLIAIAVPFVLTVIIGKRKNIA